MAEKLLEVRHLKKYFNTKAGPLHAIDDVSFSINRGETLGIVGESGCGNSTTGRCVIRLLEPTSGEVFFDGQDILKLNKNELNKVRNVSFTNLNLTYEHPECWKKDIAQQDSTDVTRK